MMNTMSNFDGTGNENQQSMGPLTDNPTAQQPFRIMIVGSPRSNHIRVRASALAHAGAQVIIISDHISDDDTGNIRVLTPDTNKTARATWWDRAVKLHRLSDLIRRTPAEVIFVHYAAGVPAWLSQTDNRLLAVSIMGSDVHPRLNKQRNIVSQWLTKRLLRQADLITSKSPYLSSAAIKHGVVPEKIMEVLWGVEPSDFEHVDSSQLRKRLGILDGAHVVFSPKPLRPAYHVDLLVEAIPRVRKAIPNVCFVISEYNADSPYRQKLHNRVAELNVIDHVRWIDGIPHNQMPEFFSLSNISVSLHDRDGFPQTVLESMASTTPCVLGRTPELEALVADDKHVVFVDFTAASVADGILSLINNRPQAERIAATGYKFVTEHAVLSRDATRVYRRLRDEFQSKPPARRGRTLVHIAILFEHVANYLRKRRKKRHKGP